MKDILEKILAYIPGFVYDYISIVTSPRTFLTERLSGEHDEYVKSLVFLGVSFSLVFLLAWLRLAPQREFWDIFAFGFIASLFLFVILSIALVIIGRIFGMAFSPRGLLTFVCYLEGVVQFFKAVVYTMGLMLVKTLSESFYKFAILADPYIHFIGAKDYMRDFIATFEAPDPETEVLAKLIIFSTLGAAMVFTFVMYAVSWRTLFYRYEPSTGKIVLAFAAFYVARFLAFGA